MRIFCCYTKAHEVLLRDFFAPTLPAGFETHSTLLDGAGPGDFLDADFIACIHRKVELIIASLRATPGEVLVWSDVDIVFYDLTPAGLERELMESGKDILFQREGTKTPLINTGFFVCRANERLIAFFEAVLDGLRADRKSNEQYVVNNLLQGGWDLKWGRLPVSYYARTHGWPPSRDLVLYHANETPGKDGVGQKIRQFEELRWIRKHGAPALAWSCLTKIPKRLKRLSAQRPG